MIKRHLLARAVVAGLLYLPLSTSVQAQATCDTCAQMTTLNSYAQDTSTNTATSSSLLQQLLQTVTLALFGTFYDIGNSMVAFTTIPAVQNNGYADQQSLLRTVETTYKGSKENGGTLINNYNTIFDNYLLPEGKGASFNENYASIASLYLNPSEAGFYTEDQRLAAQRYIILASGAAMSKVRKPSNDWLRVSNDTKDKDKAKIRDSVSAYYTYSAIESAIADNFSYIYGLNTGQTIDGTLENYNGSTISESGLLNYIQSQKAENEDWYEQLKNMGVTGLMREQTILLGGSFLMLSRIEEDLRRILITNSAQTSLTLIGTQTLTQVISQIPKSSTQSS